MSDWGGPVESQSWGDASADADATTIAQAAAAIPAENARVAAYQAQAAQFVAEHGAAANNGHNPVGT
jgi:hypothetical protein